MRCVLLAKKMAKIWLKLQENGEKKSQMAKVMAKEKYILARTLMNPFRVHSFCTPLTVVHSSMTEHQKNEIHFLNISDSTLFYLL